jgi:uncharacterized membrane protein YhaH (DUF805 family)
MTGEVSMPGMADPQEATDPHDLSKPLYGATFGQAVVRFFRSYARFSGRASRSEFWWPCLAAAIASVLVVSMWYAAILVTESDAVSTVGLIAFLVFLAAIVVPSWALLVRRLHDADMSGWWCLVTLVPYLGGVAQIAFGLVPSNPAGARFDLTAWPVDDHGTYFK